MRVHYLNLVLNKKKVQILFLYKFNFQEYQLFEIKKFFRLRKINSQNLKNFINFCFAILTWLI